MPRVQCLVSSNIPCQKNPRGRKNMTHWKTNRRINGRKVYLKIFIVVFIRVLLQLYSTRWEFSEDVLRILAWPLWWLNLLLVHLSISPCKGVWSGNLLRRQPINQGELSLVRGAGRNRQMCGQPVYSHCQSIHYIPHLYFVQTPNRTNTAGQLLEGFGLQVSFSLSGKQKARLGHLGHFGVQ